MPGVRRWLECVLLTALVIAVLAPGLGRSDYVRTEALRVVVAREMLETGDYLVPHVHGAAYLRKPPLFAWMLAGLCALTGLDISEGVARSLSVAATVLYVLTLYWGAERMFSRRCGLVAATMGLCTWGVLDYGSRAELDMTFTAWVTLAHLSLYVALRTRGGRQWLGWSGMYLAAAVATLAKGPHVIIFLGLTLLGWAFVRGDGPAAEKNFRDRVRTHVRRRREGRFFAVALAVKVGGGLVRLFVRAWASGARDALPLLLTRSHLVPAACALACVLGWAVYMASAVGSSQYARSALEEFFVRLVPYHPLHWLGWLWNVPVFVIITLPGSLPALAWVSRASRVTLSERERAAVTFLLVWLVTSLAFLTFAPAKASRYMMPVFAPVALLGGLAWSRFVGFNLPPVWSRRIARFTRLAFGLGVAGGVIGVVAVQSGCTSHLGVGQLSRPVVLVLLVAGVLATLAGLIGLFRARRRHRAGQWALITLLVLTLRPALVTVYNPLREESCSFRQTARTLDEYVPPGQPVLVFGTSPLPDLELYSSRRFLWPDPENPNAGRSAAGEHLGYYVFWKHRDWDLFTSGLRYAIRETVELPQDEATLVLAVVDFARPTSAAARSRPATLP